MTTEYKIGDYVWFSYQKPQNGIYTNALGKIVDIEYRMSKEGTCVKIQSWKSIENTEDTFWVFIGQLATDEDTIKSITAKLNTELKQKIKEDILAYKNLKQKIEKDILAYKNLIDKLQNQLSEIEDII